jgi:hypothetical protein
MLDRTRPRRAHRLAGRLHLGRGRFRQVPLRPPPLPANPRSLEARPARRLRLPVPVQRCRLRCARLLLR